MDGLASLLKLHWGGVGRNCNRSIALVEEATSAAEEDDFGAGEGNRTLVCSLGSCRSTIELRPRSPWLLGSSALIADIFR